MLPLRLFPLLFLQLFLGIYGAKAQCFSPCVPSRLGNGIFSCFGFGIKLCVQRCVGRFLEILFVDKVEQHSQHCQAVHAAAGLYSILQQCTLGSLITLCVRANVAVVCCDVQQLSSQRRMLCCKQALSTVANEMQCTVWMWMHEGWPTTWWQSYAAPLQGLMGPTPAASMASPTLTTFHSCTATMASSLVCFPCILLDVLFYMKRNEPCLL